jgi:hypothetical protein
MQAMAGPRFAFLERPKIKQVEIAEAARVAVAARAGRAGNAQR